MSKRREGGGEACSQVESSKTGARFGKRWRCCAACLLPSRLTPVGVVKYATAELMLIVVLINSLSAYRDFR